MASSALNNNDDDYINLFHGWSTNFPDTIDNFTHGAFAIRQLENDSNALNQAVWRCDDTQALLAGRNGCQLIDLQDKCFGWAPADGETTANNEDDDSNPIVNLQWVDCLIYDPNDFDDELFQKQLWFAEPWSANTSKVVLRQVCSTDVVIKTPGPSSHNALYPNQAKKGCRYPKHFDLRLVDPSECLNDYQFNDCTWL